MIALAHGVDAGSFRGICLGASPGPHVFCSSYALERHRKTLIAWAKTNGAENIWIHKVKQIFTQGDFSWKTLTSTRSSIKDLWTFWVEGPVLSIVHNANQARLHFLIEPMGREAGKKSGRTTLWILLYAATRAPYYQESLNRFWGFTWGKLQKLWNDEDKKNESESNNTSH